MNPGCTPAWIGFGHFLDKTTDFTIGFWSSRTFGFDFPEKLKALAGQRTTVSGLTMTRDLRQGLQIRESKTQKSRSLT
ncbi:MAG: hypothetical protein GY702_05850 [Desulfobulbaceae bacterium]|nr:hypothetical protein [Desulfobulbaceae bacterium]